MKVVVDTNVFISGTLNATGTPGKILDAWRAKRFQLITSHVLIRELRETLSEPKLAKRVTTNQLDVLLRRIEDTADVVVPSERLSVVARDADDNAVIEAAVAAGADYMVTGDKDLLSMGKYAEILIITPREFLARLEFYELE